MCAFVCVSLGREERPKKNNGIWTSYYYVTLMLGTFVLLVRSQLTEWMYKLLALECHPLFGHWKKCTPEATVS